MILHLYALSPHFRERHLLAVNLRVSQCSECLSDFHLLQNFGTTCTAVLHQILPKAWWCLSGNSLEDSRHLVRRPWESWELSSGTYIHLKYAPHWQSGPCSSRPSTNWHFWASVDLYHADSSCYHLRTCGCGGDKHLFETAFWVNIWLNREATHREATHRETTHREATHREATYRESTYRDHTHRSQGERERAGVGSPWNLYHNC